MEWWQLAGCAVCRLRAVEVESATLRVDRFAVDEDEFRVGFSVLFRDRDELPFSVQPAILFKVDSMSIVLTTARLILPDR